MKKILLLCFSFVFVLSVWAQDRVITGKVTSADDGSEVPGVNVLVKGTTNGSVTDASGKFSIQAQENSVLQFSFIGYVTQEITVGKRSTIDISLVSDTKQLSEVIVTGYREESTKSTVGPVARVSSKQIENVPIASIDQVLQGRSPGLLVLGNSGQPGSSASVLIRGKGSFTGATDPLYILDGVPIDPGRFNTINWNDMENVSVLKDASSTSQYGSRGANGVILLTSKKGKSGQTQFSYNAQFGQSAFPDNKIELMNTNQKIDYELLRGGTVLSTYTAEQIAQLRTVNTNWQDVLFKKGALQSHELSASGGNDKTTFFVSGSIFNQEGTVIQTKLKRYNARINLRHESGNFRFGLSSSLGYSQNQNTNEGDAFIGSPLNAVRWANPYETPRDATGKFTAIRTGQPNPLQEILDNPRSFDDIKVVGSLSGEYDVPFIKGLTIKTVWGVDYDQRDRTNYNDRTTYSGSQATGQQGSYARSNRYDARFVNTNSINYTKTFGTDHTLTAGLFYEVNYRKIRNFNFTGYGLTGNLKNEAGITISSVFLPVVGGSNTESSLEGYFADAKYGYRNRYFLKAGFRRDGSSRFGSAYKVANFYSVGASWVISDESFMESLSNKLNLLKLRTSFGTTGNQDGIGDFQSKELYSSGFTYNGSAGIQQIQLSSPQLRWEAQQTLDIGIDFAAFNNRIRGGFSFYNRITNDLLLDKQISRTSGYTSITQNVGQLRNRGIEINLDVDVIKTQSFSWGLTANFTNNINEVIALTGGNQNGTGTVTQVVGKPMDSNYAVDYVGVNPANGDALYRKLDGSITNIFSASDLKVHGTRTPPRFGGLSNSFTYKGIELSVFFTFVEGNQIYNNDRTNVENPTYLVDQMAVSNLRAWQKPGDITDVPRQATINGLDSDPFQSQTTRYLENGSFVRLRNVQLSYNVPSKVLSSIKLRAVRVYVQGQNLWTRSEFMGWDPELASGTLIGAQYPALKSYTVGLNIGF
jgi:TonB-dependent starch-binding outer membrane protein SusC